MQRPVIVTAKNPRRERFGDVPDLTPEEHERRGDAAEALFRELTRRVRGECNVTEVMPASIG